MTLTRFIVLARKGVNRTTLETDELLNLCRFVPEWMLESQEKRLSAAIRFVTFHDEGAARALSEAVDEGWV